MVIEYMMDDINVCLILDHIDTTSQNSSHDYLVSIICDRGKSIILSDMPIENV